MTFSVSSVLVDIIILAFLAIYVFIHSRKGFIYGTLDTIGFLLSLVIALRFYPLISQLLQVHFSFTRGISNAIGFLVVASISEPILYIFFSIIDNAIHKKIIETRVNKILGFIPALISGLIITAFFLTTIIILPTRPDIKQSVVESKVGKILTYQTLGLEKYLSDIFGGAVQETLGFLTIKPSGNDHINLKFKTDDFSPDPISEIKMLDLINTERKNRNIHLLSINLELREVARKHCKDMFLKGYFSHYSPEGLSPFDRMEDQNIIYNSAGENLAYAPNVDIAHEGLMNSPGHKANILSHDFKKVGIGVISAGVYGKMFCQEFSN